jgi:hypothetical protein
MVLMNSLSERRLVENEVIFRSANKDAEEFIIETQGADAVLHFYCECSHTECKQHITLSAQKYEELHKNNRQFIAIPGHEVPEVERIVLRTPKYIVIEKYGDPPSDKEVKAALKKLTT